MAGLSDETLMAYADGELDATENAAVEVAVQQCPEYQLKVAKFRATRAFVRQAFANEASPGRVAPLAAKIRRGADYIPVVSGRGAAARPGVTGWRRRLPAMAAQRSWPAAIAAGLALLIGGGLGWFTRGLPPHPPASDLIAFQEGNLLAQGALSNLLENASSGTRLQVHAAKAPAWQLEASFSFRARDGTLCRRYELTNDASGRFAGFARRGGAGRWIVHAQAQAQAQLGPKPSDGASFVPAEGDPDAPLDAAIRAAMEGDMLTSPEEAGLIARGWSSQSK